MSPDDKVVEKVVPADPIKDIAPISPLALKMMWASKTLTKAK